MRRCGSWFQSPLIKCNDACHGIWAILFCGCMSWIFSDGFPRQLNSLFCFGCVYNYLLCLVSFSLTDRVYISFHSIFCQILMHTNCTFELLSVRPVKRRREQDVGVATSPSSSNTPLLKLKGQMMLLTLTDIDYIAFLCSPA